MENVTDEALAERVRAGETSLYEVIMRRYNSRLYRIVRGIVGDAAEAEDVVQQAYVNAYLHLDQFSERAKFATWLTKIAIYEALGRVRRRQKVPMVGFDTEEDPGMGVRLPAASTPDPERQAMAGEIRELLEKAIDALPDAYRSVFVLREIEHLSTAETAACLEVTEETVKTRLHRSRAMLRESLYERAGVAGSEVFELHLSRCDSIVNAVMARLPRPS
jgi:RNA polymerase sigma-70 factor, ECF subfamily